MRIVIIGTGGRLGGAFLGKYSGDFEVTGLSRSDLDLTDPAAIRRVLEPLEYDRLLLPGALTLVDYCESHRDEAFAVNAEAPRIIAELSAAKGAHVTYFSTDFVFDGSAPEPYNERAAAGPLSVYGASKLQGEENVLAVSDKNLVIRVSWLYGAGKPAFPEWIIGQAMKQADLALPAEKIGNNTRAEDLIEYVDLLLGLERGQTAAAGIFHLANSGFCSWREYGQFCLDAALARGLPLKATKIAGNRMEDIRAFVAPRPVNSVFDLSKFTIATGVTPRFWKEALDDHLSTSPFFQSAVPAAT